MRSYFPASISTREYSTPDKHAGKSRLAWCYGDIGILCTLLNVARWTKNDQLENRVVDMLIRTIERRDMEDTHILDAGFCHGTAGAGYLYLYIYKLTGNNIFKNASDAWLEDTLLFSRQDEDKTMGGYLFEYGASGWIPLSSVLDGIGGIALFLLAAVNPQNDDSWNECLFIS